MLEHVTLVQPPPPTTLPVLPATPTTPSLYHQMLRGPRFRWWRPLVCLLLFAALTGAIFGLVGLVVAGGFALAPSPRWGDPLSEVADTPASMLFLNLMLASLIVSTVLSAWIVHRVRPGFLVSVIGRFRWRWLGRCVAVLLPLWAVYLTVYFLVDPLPSGRPDHWVILLVMSLVLTPFQAAGEEFVFRGWLTQQLGAYFRHPVVGLVVSTVLSATAFAFAHGSIHLWILLDLGVFGAAASLVTWRTGGLEAGIAIHAVNNVSLFVVTTTVGGYADSFVETDTTGDPVSVLWTIAIQAIAVALILWQARRAQITRVFTPIAPPAPPAPAAIWIAPLGY